MHVCVSLVTAWVQEWIPFWRPPKLGVSWSTHNTYYSLDATCAHHVYIHMGVLSTYSLLLVHAPITPLNGVYTPDLGPFWGYK